MIIDLKVTETNDYNLLLEEKLYEELGVSAKVKNAAKQLTIRIAKLVRDFTPNFENSNVNKQNALAKLMLSNDSTVSVKIQIFYYSDINALKIACSKRQSDAWFDPSDNTLFLVVDVINKRFDHTSIVGLLQHEITHAYQELMKNSHGVKTVVGNSYENAVSLCFSDNENVSAAAMAVYFSNYGEMSANANELYPWFYKTVSENEPFEKYLNSNMLYNAIVSVRKLNKTIEHYGADNVLKEPAKQIGIPISALKPICKKFPKIAMANICRVYQKAKNDFENKLNENVLDHKMSMQKRYIRNKIGFFDENY